MMFKVLWIYTLIKGIFGEKHPNMKCPSEDRMEALRLYWFLRDVKRDDRQELLRNLEAEYEEMKSH
jgi:hypothetical protein